MSSLDVFGTVLRLLLRLEELRSSATEQHEILVAQMQVQVRRNPAKNKSLTTENDTMKNTHVLLAFMLVTIGMDTTFRCFSRLIVGIVNIAHPP